MSSHKFLKRVLVKTTTIVYKMGRLSNVFEYYRLSEYAKKISDEAFYNLLSKGRGLYVSELINEFYKLSAGNNTENLKACRDTVEQINELVNFEVFPEMVRMRVIIRRLEILGK